MDIKEMNIEQVEARKAELMASIESANDNETLDSIENELTALEERKAEIARVAAEAEETRRLAAEKGEVISKLIPQEDRTMPDVKEIRNSEAYINAFAEYVKTHKDEEIRTLFSTAIEGGTVAIPDFVYDIIKTAWDNEPIMSKIPEIEINGDFSVNFEISGTDAVIHVEGSGAVTEEDLVLGIATIEMDSIKKWIGVSKKVMKLRGRAFLEYIYREIAHKIAKKSADDFIAKVIALPSTATATSPSAAVLTSAPEVNTVGDAISYLSDEAGDPVVMMNKRTKPAFVAAAKAANYAMDVFENCTILYNNTIPAYTEATAGQVYMIVGDLKQGAVKTKPEGDDDQPEFIFDELSRKKENIVEILGEQMRGAGVIADKAFTLVKKPASV